MGYTETSQNPGPYLMIDGLALCLEFKNYA